MTVPTTDPLSPSILKVEVRRPRPLSRTDSYRRRECKRKEGHREGQTRTLTGDQWSTRRVEVSMYLLVTRSTRDLPFLFREQK